MFTVAATPNAVQPLTPLPYTIGTVHSVAVLGAVTSTLLPFTPPFSTHLTFPLRGRSRGRSTRLSRCSLPCSMCSEILALAPAPPLHRLQQLPRSRSQASLACGALLSLSYEAVETSPEVVLLGPKPVLKAPLLHGRVGSRLSRARRKVSLQIDESRFRAVAKRCGAGARYSISFTSLISSW